MTFGAGIGRAAIPNPDLYDSGKIVVPENYLNPTGKTLEIYWERLKSTSSNPKALVVINGGPGFPHGSFHCPDPQNPGKFKEDYFHALRDQFEIYYFDQRGNGNSGQLTEAVLMAADKSAFGTETICRDIEELRKQVIGKDRLSLLGESYGGMVALSFPFLFPDQTEKVILHDTCPSNDYYLDLARNKFEGIQLLDRTRFPGLLSDLETVVKAFDAGQIQLSPGMEGIRSKEFLQIGFILTYSFRGQDALAKMVKQLAQEKKSPIFDAVFTALNGDSGTPSSYLTTFLVQSTEMQNEEKIQNMLSTGPDYPIFKKASNDEECFVPRRSFKKKFDVHFFKEYNRISHLGRLKVPVLIFVGRFDMVTPQRYSELMAREIGKNATLVILNNSAHDGFIQENKFVIGKIREFFAGRRPVDLRFPISASFQEMPSKRKPVTIKDAVDAVRFGKRYLPF
jgi:pimeloyl-ACP methyl ester carboxylesterase